MKMPAAMTSSLMIKSWLLILKLNNVIVGELAPPYVCLAADLLSLAFKYIIVHRSPPKKRKSNTPSNRPKARDIVIVTQGYPVAFWPKPPGTLSATSWTFALY
jgi:hypothetical protein